MRAMKRQGPSLVEKMILKKNIWSYRDEPRHGVVAAITLTAILALIVSFLRGRGLYLSMTLFLIMAPVILWAVFKMSRGTTVEIDREAGVLQKREGWFFFRTLMTWPLRDFTSLKVVGRTVSVEEGYRIVTYVVMLEGVDRSLEVLSTEDEQQGRSLQRELSGFLGLS